MVANLAIEFTSTDSPEVRFHARVAVLLYRAPSFGRSRPAVEVLVGSFLGACGVALVLLSGCRWVTVDGTVATLDVVGVFRARVHLAPGIAQRSRVLG
jgi:hypothetical protein